jgi:hypothetical protein
MYRYRDPIPHNMCVQHHPIVYVGDGVKHDEFLWPGWTFDRSVGEPWSHAELTEMVLQGHQLQRWDGAVDPV